MIILLILLLFSASAQAYEIRGNTIVQDTLKVDFISPEDSSFITMDSTVVNGSLTVPFLDLGEVTTVDSPAVDYIRLFAVEDDEFTVLETITNLGVRNRINQDVFRIARNTSGGPLARGTVVRFSGSTGNKPNFAAAQSDTIVTMPAVGILGTAVANNGYGEVMIVGRLSGLKTDYTNAGEPTYAPVADWTEGDILYVNSAVLGALQNSKPTHPNFSQWIATIEKVHVDEGILLIKTQAMLGLEDGTNSNTYTLGDGTAGTKTLTFSSDADGSITWDGSDFVVPGYQEDSDTNAFDATKTWSQAGNILLNHIGNPDANHTFNMANKTLIWNFTNPAGGVEYNVSGAFTGEVIHLHQHTGNPGKPTHLIHMEADDADVVPLHCISSGDTNSYFEGGLVWADSITTPVMTVSSILNLGLHTIAEGDSVFGNIINDAADSTIKCWNGSAWITIVDLIP
jgi:hypothetical protein